MRTLLLVGLSGLAGVPVAFGGDQGSETQRASAHRTSAADIDVPDVAADAVNVVDSFSRSLGRGDLEAASQHLDPSVVILEHGRSERTAAEYLELHGKADARFLRDTRQKVMHRKAGASGDLAWVVTDREIEGQADGKPLTLSSSETMVLKRSSAGRWRIVHIHWSSRKITSSPSP
jgi:ketosteroid isomerase-like protein